MARRGRHRLISQLYRSMARWVYVAYRWAEARGREPRTAYTEDGRAFRVVTRDHLFVDEEPISSEPFRVRDVDGSEYRRDSR